MHSGDLLSIGEFAGLTRLSVKALRHYDEQGLLAPVQVDPASGYRYYSPTQVERATLIGTMRTMDVPLAVIRDVLDRADGEPSAAVGAFRAWWGSQERRHQQRQGIGLYVTHRLLKQGATMNIQTRTVPERKLAVLSKELYQPQLEEFIMSAFTTLFDYAAAHPGLRPLDTTPEWPTYALFHGPVTQDQSALVEVCIVIEGAGQPEGEVVIRLEPEHEEAYTTLTKAELRFPEILDAYDAVAAWVHANGAMLDRMPSREVYTADVLAAGDSDPVCDVAFPYLPR